MSILERLRNETQHQHKALEDLLPIMSPELQHSGYRQLLTRFYGFYLPVESQLCQVPYLESALPDWPQRRKIDWLVSDLIALGFTREELADVPLCHRLPVLPGVDEALGCLYVLEGSTLGGQLIGRHLQTTLHLGSDNGASFFLSYRDNVGPMWKAFREALLSSPPESADRIVIGATQTFDCMYQWLKVQPTRS